MTNRRWTDKDNKGADRKDLLAGSHHTRNFLLFMFLSRILSLSPKLSKGG
jgi:hypothetical protein